MNASKMKNMIVLRNLPSNIIEEAFIILKPNKKIKIENTIIERNYDENSQKNNTNEYLLKEAEMVLNNCFSGIENKNVVKNAKTNKIEKKYKKLKNITIFLGMILAVILINNII